MLEFRFQGGNGALVYPPGPKPIARRVHYLGVVEPSAGSIAPPGDLLCTLCTFFVTFCTALPSLLPSLVDFIANGFSKILTDKVATRVT